MNIVFFTDTFYPTTNGIVTSIIAYSEALVRRGHTILIVAPYIKGIEQFSSPNIEILPVRWLPALFYPDFKVTFGFTPKILKKIRNFHADILHFHTQFVLGWEAVVLGKILGIPRVGTFHTYIADDGYLSVLGIKKLRIIGRNIGWKYNNFFYTYCEQVFTPSQNAYDELVSHGIDADTIAVIPNPCPIAPHTFWTHGEKKTRFLDAYKDHNIVLYVGRLSCEKSVTVCFDAIYILSREIPNILFVIVGDGPNRGDLAEYAEKLGITRNVLFLGKIPHETLLASDIYDYAKLFLTASCTETQGVTLLEAMSHGLPIVGVNEKWVGEIIEDNGYKARAGFSGELALYCLRILRDEALRIRLGQRSREIVKKYHPDNLVIEVEKIYNTLIASYATK